MGTGRKKNEKKGSWAVFFMVIGMIFIMLSPQVEQPMSLIVTGLAIILISLIYWKKERSRDDQKETEVETEWKSERS